MVRQSAKCEERNLIATGFWRETPEFLNSMEALRFAGLPQEQAYAVCDGEYRRIWRLSKCEGFIEIAQLRERNFFNRLSWWAHQTYHQLWRGRRSGIVVHGAQGVGKTTDVNMLVEEIWLSKAEKLCKVFKPGHSKWGWGHFRPHNKYGFYLFCSF